VRVVDGEQSAPLSRGPLRLRLDAETEDCGCVAFSYGGSRLTLPVLPKGWRVAMSHDQGLDEEEVARMARDHMRTGRVMVECEPDKGRVVRFNAWLERADD